MQAISPEDLALATPEELAVYENSLRLELALSSPLDYAEHVSRNTQRYLHIDFLNDLIVRLVHGRLTHPITKQPVRKLAVSMPPRHGKSYLISDHFPAWAVTKWAGYGFRVGLAGYEADFAAGWGRKAREHVTETSEEFGIQVDNATKAADRWELRPLQSGGPKGGMDTAGVGGPFTGKGFHAIVIDDPIKNAEEALSQAIRDKAYNWLGSTALNRLEPLITTADGTEVGRCVILVQTRWHEDDLMGRVLRDEPDEWFHLNLKALADENAPHLDPLNRQPGEALCPQRFSADDLNKIKVSPTTGGYWFAAQYQGEPNIEGGGLFKRASFRYWRPVPDSNTAELISQTGVSEFIQRDNLTRFQTIDLAATSKTTSDFNVISTWDVTPDRRLLHVDRRRQRVESADHDRFIIKAYEELSPSWIGVEVSAYHLGVITRLAREGYPIRPLTADKDKVSRAIPAGIAIDHGRIFFLQPAQWLEDWESELLVFPNGTFDDQVDTLAYAALVITTGALSSPQRKPAEAPDYSIEARLDRYLKARYDKRCRHPILGKWAMR